MVYSIGTEDIKESAPYVPRPSPADLLTTDDDWNPPFRLPPTPSELPALRRSLPNPRHMATRDTRPAAVHSTQSYIADLVDGARRNDHFERCVRRQLRAFPTRNLHAPLNKPRNPVADATIFDSLSLPTTNQVRRDMHQSALLQTMDQMTLRGTDWQHRDNPEFSLDGPSGAARPPVQETGTNNARAPPSGPLTVGGRMIATDSRDPGAVTSLSKFQTRRKRVHGAAFPAPARHPASQKDQAPAATAQPSIRRGVKAQEHVPVHRDPDTCEGPEMEEEGRSTKHPRLTPVHEEDINGELSEDSAGMRCDGHHKLPALATPHEGERKLLQPERLVSFTPQTPEEIAAAITRQNVFNKGGRAVDHPGRAMAKSKEEEEENERRALWRGGQYMGPGSPVEGA